MRKTKTITLDDLKQGSDAVLKQVYEDNRDKFINFAKRYNISDDDILDVYQDAYIVFYDNVMNGRIQNFTSTISTYVISIGKYIILDKLKKANRTVNPDFDISLVRPKEELIDHLDIDTEELTKEQQLLYQHFNTLGKKCKELLDLFYYRGFTIGDILELKIYNSENVIKSTKSRCLKTLKERIEERILNT
ncbi:RNA polymerase sigma factor [Aquimarina litoralis]|uniref:RNA polymerase sigma factor n=1 Tax=Aquimarina litoralis TaxID=584605 RepID=UPI001C5A008E|nr:sigma-70 family RNA polymerase sigma factor [Aquimarina litoralis]MBW1296413.1 sigma-70 family RNA polymerase sigma factor [Aquimarina litoralis]